MDKYTGGHIRRDHLTIRGFRWYTSNTCNSFGIQRYREKEKTLSFLNSFLSYLVVLVVIAVVGAVAITLGITLRKKKNAAEEKKQTEE